MDPLTSQRAPPKAESLLKYDFEKDDATCERLGFRCPVKVFEVVNADAVASAPGRRDAVQAKDLRDDKKSRAAIRRLFPCMPIDSAETILEHGFQKGSGRVGRTTTLDEDRKVKLAVEAHIRHNFTPYEKLLRERKEGDLSDDRRREKARAIIRPKILEILAQWSSNLLLDVVTPPTSVIVASALEVATAVIRSTSPIIGDTVTRSYHTRQAVRSTSELSVQMATLENSIHARGPRWKIRKRSEDASLIAPTTTRTSSQTSARTAEDIRSPQKVSNVTLTTATAKDDTPTIPRAALLEAPMHASMSTQNLFRHGPPSAKHHSSLGERSKTLLFETSTHTNEITQESSQEIVKKILNPSAEHRESSSASFNSSSALNRKRHHEDNEDTMSVKRPRHQPALASLHGEQPLRPMDTECSSIGDPLPSHGNAGLYIDFDAMHLDEKVEPLIIAKDDSSASSLPVESISRTVADQLPHSGVLEREQLDMSISKRVVDVRHEVRSRLLKSVVRLPKQQSRTLPGQPEQCRLTQIKALLNGHRARCLFDLKNWKRDFQLFAKFSETRQINVILAEFRENLLEGRMDYNFIFVEHVGKAHKNAVGETFSNHPKRSTTTKDKHVIDDMVGQARKDYSKIKADPYYENTLSAERSWAAWLVFENGPKQGLRDALQKRQLEMTGDNGSSKEKVFEILNDEEDDEDAVESEISDNGVVSHDLSSLSERPVHRPGQDHLVNPFLARPKRDMGLDGASDFAPAEKEKKTSPSDKENSLAIIG
ncbi:hypothetical protein MMC27_003537 [Xylographa pallens]|nr:hypothetical protein [Xylographa pallens]